MTVTTLTESRFARIERRPYAVLVVFDNQNGDEVAVGFDTIAAARHSLYQALLELPLELPLDYHQP